MGGGGASGMVQVDDQATSCGAGAQAASAWCVGPCLLSLDRSRCEPHSRRRDCLDLAVRDEDDDESTR